MSESAERIFERAADHLRMPPLVEWETFPFEGEMRPRDLLPPAAEDRRRSGEAGVDCRSCETPDSSYLWTDDRWRVRPTREPTGLPMVLFLEPREHYAEPGDLPDELAAEMGRMIGRVERAVRSIGEIGRVHVCRWGDGSEHLHWWFMARPARLPQLVGSFAAIWDDILPPTPEEIWRTDLVKVADALRAST